MRVSLTTVFSLSFKRIFFYNGDDNNNANDNNNDNKNDVWKSEPNHWH